MKRIALAILAIALVIGSVAPSFAVELQARGSWRAVGSWWDNADFDKDNGEETFRATERARLWFDFIANENLKAVLGLEIGDFRWGNGAGALGGDAVGIKVKHAYLDFNLPNTSVNVKAGLQPIYIPGNLGSPLLDDDATALMISAPINEMIGITAGWIRAYDASDDTQGTFLTAADAMGHDEMDTIALLVPVTADGFDITPYFLYTMIGNNSGAGLTNLLGLNSDIFNDPNSLFSDFNKATMTDDASMWHVGFSGKVTMLDPVVIMFDAVYGSADLELDNEDVDMKGYVLDLAVDYKMDFMTPELFMYYASGNDDGDDLTIMPTISPDMNWNTFSADGSAIGQGNTMGFSSTAMAPVWSIGLKLKDLSFVEDLSHTFTIFYAKGTSDDDAWWFTEEDSMVEVDFDTKYQIYDELAAYLELGYINLDLEDDSDAENAYKCALGVRYDF